jgi:hypothetical protein
MIGMGRKMDVLLSRVIPGGGTSFDDEDVEEVDGGKRGGTVEGTVVEICSGRDNLLAY